MHPPGDQQQIKAGTAMPGYYTLQYVATDGSGNAAVGQRSFEIRDASPPEVQAHANGAPPCSQLAPNYAAKPSQPLGTAAQPTSGDRAEPHPRPRPAPDIAEAAPKPRPAKRPRAELSHADYESETMRRMAALAKPRGQA